MATTTDPIRKLGLIGVLVLGGIILAIHLYLYKINAIVFSAFISFYVLLFSILMVWYIYYLKKDNDKPPYFDIVTFIGYYTALLQLILLFMSVATWIRIRKKK